MQAEKDKTISATLRDGGDCVLPSFTFDEFKRLFQPFDDTNSESSDDGEGEDISSEDDGEEHQDGAKDDHSHDDSDPAFAELLAGAMEDFDANYEQNLQEEFEGSANHALGGECNETPLDDDEGEAPEEE